MGTNCRNEVTLGLAALCPRCGRNAGKPGKVMREQLVKKHKLMSGKHKIQNYFKLLFFFFLKKCDDFIKKRSLKCFECVRRCIFKIGQDVQGHQQLSQNMMKRFIYSVASTSHFHDCEINLEGVSVPFGLGPLSLPLTTTTSPPQLRQVFLLW